MTVDYEKNSIADTGLFVKVVPEKWKPTAMVEVDSPFNSSVAEAADPVPFTTGYHRQWMENINKKLAALRIRVNTQQTLSYSRSKHQNTWLSHIVVRYKYLMYTNCFTPKINKTLFFWYPYVTIIDLFWLWCDGIKI